MLHGYQEQLMANSAYLYIYIYIYIYSIHAFHPLISYLIHQGNFYEIIIANKFLNLLSQRFTKQPDEHVQGR